MPSDHPKQTLLFFVAQDLNDAVRMNVRELVLQLATQRQWLLGPPHFLDLRNYSVATNSSDVPIETVGGYLEIYSAIPPSKLPREIDLQHFDEIMTIVDTTRHFSRQSSLAFEFELDGTFVGSIADGEMDHALAEGLLGEWKRQLGVSD